MRIEQRVWDPTWGWDNQGISPLSQTAQIIIVFGSKHALREPDLLRSLRSWYPNAAVTGCSTAGEIVGTLVKEDSLVATAIEFASTQIRTTYVSVAQPEGSRDAGVRLARSLIQDDLRHVLVLSDGLNVNGSHLVEGLTSTLPKGVALTGGLSGDDDRFENTLVVVGDTVAPKHVAAVGLYGTRLQVGFASRGGWHAFGPERLVTKSSGTTLQELDGKSALDLYKSYLGDQASGLPATGLLFPMSVRVKEGDIGVVRTLLSIDESNQSLVFASDIPEGAYARLMTASPDRLIDGAEVAATVSREGITLPSAELALLISCVGRKLVLGQRVEEEVEAVRGILGNQTAIAGFYSYGEICPFSPNGYCELHNQTMTITTLAEI